MDKILSEVQKFPQEVLKCIIEFEDLINKEGDEKIFKEFLKRFVFTLKQDSKVYKTALDKVFNFLVNLILYLEEKTSGRIFLNEFYNSVIQCLSNVNFTIRFNTISLLNKYILQIVEKDLLIDEDFCESLIPAVIDLLSDNILIKVKAVEVLKYIQGENNIPVSAALVEVLSDSNTKARLAAVEAISITNLNICFILFRCRDIDIAVRLAAFMRISKIPVQRFTIAQRQSILNDAMLDCSPKIGNFVESTLLPYWLKCYNFDILALLKGLQFDANEKEIEEFESVSTYVITSLLKSQTKKDIFETLHLEDKLIPLNNLTLESAFYWNNIIRYLHENHSEDLESFLPNTVDFCDYLLQFFKTCELCKGEEWEQVLFQAIVYHLIGIAVHCEILDTLSRNKIQSTFVIILKEEILSERVTSEIVEFFETLIPDVNCRISFLCELLCEIRMPVETKFLPKLEVSLRIEDLKEKLKTLQDNKSNSIENEDYSSAKLLSEEINEIKSQLKKIEQKTDDENVDVKKNNDPIVINKYLDIIYAMMQFNDIKKISSALLSVKEELLKDFTLSHTSVIQAKIFKCFGAICCLDKAISEQNLQFFCLSITCYVQYKDCSVEVLIESINCVTDMVLLHGTNIFSCQSSIETSNDLNQSADLFSNDCVTLTNFVDMLHTLIDDNNLEVRECASICLSKMMCTERIHSSIVFYRLFLKWISPVSANDTKLRQVLGVFIETYSSLPNVEKQIENSIIPILKAVALAPPFSPLSSLSKDELLKTIINVLNLRNNKDYPLHENVAMEVVKEILKNPTSKAVPFLIKSLLYYEIYRNNEEYIEELLELCEDIEVELTELIDKITLKNLKKFIYSLKHE